MEENKFPNVKEVYGSVAKDYAHFRPRYPPLLFSFLSSLTPQHDLAWDVGTGTGPFYPQVKTVLKKPGGVIAVWSCMKGSADPAVDAICERFSQRALPLSHPGGKLVLEEYKTLPFPFREVEGIKVEIEEQRNFEEYMGLFRTSSAFVSRQEILDEFIPEFEAAWGGPLHVTRVIKFPICLKIGKV